MAGLFEALLDRLEGTEQSGVAAELHASVSLSPPRSATRPSTPATRRPATAAARLLESGTPAVAVPACRRSRTPETWGPQDPAPPPSLESSTNSPSCTARAYSVSLAARALPRSSSYAAVCRHEFSGRFACGGGRVLITATGRPSMSGTGVGRRTACGTGSDMPSRPTFICTAGFNELPVMVRFRGACDAVVAVLPSASGPRPASSSVGLHVPDEVLGVAWAGSEMWIRV